MTDTAATVEVTEFIEIDPDELHLVGSAANGFKALLAKSASEEVREILDTIAEVTNTTIVKTADGADDTKCDACGGSGVLEKSLDKCKKCLGSGIQPVVGMSADELMAAAKASDGTAASGQPVPLPEDCPTCNGTGSDQGFPCEACNGTGHVGSMPSDEEQSTRQGFEGKVSVGDPQGREKIDKSSEDDDDDWLVDQIQFEDSGLDLEKAKLKAKQRRALPKSAFAIPEKAPGSGSYPIPDESHARNALARVSQFGTPEEKSRVRAAVRRRYPGIEMDKAMGDGSMFSGANPQLAVADVSDDTPNDDSVAMPGSPAWEAVDATMATEAALALMAAGELIRQFGQREAIEVAAGEGNDIFDTFEAQQAMCDVSHALGIIASLAFHEGLEATKSLDGDVEKSGKRLSSKSISKISNTRDNAKQLADHLTELLGDDDPAKKSDDGPGMSASEKFIANANKAVLAKEITSMSTDELEKVLDARDEKLVGLMSAAIAEGLAAAEEASKGKAAMDEANSVSNAKTAHRRAKAKNPKDDDTDLEDEADQGDMDSANTSPKGSAKALEDMTPEEIAAHEQFEAAKALMKEAKKARKQAEQDAAVAKEIREGIEEATKAFETLQERLGTVDDLKERLSVVEKNVVPGGPARTAPPEAAIKSRQREEIENEVARLDGLARNATDREVRKAYEGRARDELAKLATLGV